MIFSEARRKIKQEDMEDQLLSDLIPSYSDLNPDIFRSVKVERNDNSF